VEQVPLLRCILLDTSANLNNNQIVTMDLLKKPGIGGNPIGNAMVKPKNPNVSKGQVGEMMYFTPLGAGSEVGRSCHVLRVSIIYQCTL
jgi:hypothetical protein